MTIVDEAVALAGIDPRDLHAQLMAGQPDRIVSAAKAFEDAGRSARDAYDRGRAAQQTVATNFTNDRTAVLDADAESREAWRLLGQGGLDMEDTARLLKQAVTQLEQAQRSSTSVINQMIADLNRLAASWNRRASADPPAGAGERQQFLAEAAAVVRAAAGRVQTAIDDYDSVLGRGAGELLSRGYPAAAPVGVGYEGGADTVAAPPVAAPADLYRGQSAPNAALTGSDVAGGFYGARLQNSALGLRGQAGPMRASAESNLARLRALDSVADPDAFYRDLDYHESRQAQAQRLAGQADTLDARAGRLPLKLSGPLAAVGVVADVAGGKPPVQAIASGGAGFAASVGVGFAASAASSALAGAAVGSVVPVVGTAVGAVVGAGVGIFASGAVDSLFENGLDVGKAFDRGTEALTDTGAAIGDGVAGAARGIAGLFD